MSYKNNIAPDDIDYDRARDLVIQIGDVRSSIRDALYDPEKLTKIQSELAIIGSELKEFVALLHAVSTDVEMSTYFTFRKTSTATDARAEAKKAKIEPRKQYEYVKALVDGNEKNISTIRARLDHLSEVNKNSNAKNGSYVNR